jgi:hypothetical protein
MTLSMGPPTAPCALNTLQVSVAAVKVAQLKDVDWSAINVLALHIFGETDTQLGKPGAAIFEPKDSKFVFC